MNDVTYDEENVTPISDDNANGSPQEQTFQKESFQEETFQEEAFLIEAEVTPMQESDPVQEPDSATGKHQTSRTPNYEEFLRILGQTASPDEKLDLAIRFMENALSQSGNPDFKHFWEVRKLCLDYFKEPVNPSTRTLLWSKYSELSKEARRLKEILDEQTAFAVEQIDIAIAALEQEIAQFEEHLDKVPVVQFPHVTKSFTNHIPGYEKTQRQLNLFNAYASRVNLLRKELMKTEMRVRQKNRFFQRLSEIGDKVFPLRKEWIKEISQKFITDIDAFINENFPLENKHGQPFHVLRDEIKSLQGIAKILTLNTHAFNQTRLKLSECWDKIRQEEKEHKKEVSQHRNESKERLQHILKYLEEIRVLYTEQTKTAQETDRALEAMMGQLRRQDLMRDDQKLLRQEIDRFRKEIENVLSSQRNAREREVKEAQRLRQETLKALKAEIQELHTNASTMELEPLRSQMAEICDKIASASLSKTERQEFDRSLKLLKDAVIEREESSISLSDNDQQALKQLYEILKQRQERRKEIKSSLETLRKASGNTGLDIEQAMAHNEKISAERERFEKITFAVEEIEDKIRQIRNPS